MSVIQYILEALMIEDQATAKRIAADESTNFSMDDLETLKTLIPSKLYSKSLGWIATNWDDLPHEEIGELINTFFEYSGKKDNNLKHNLNDYKDAKSFITDVKRVNASLTLNRHKKPENKVNTLWESSDKKISVIVPITKDASVKHGRKAKWCTAADTNRGSTYDTDHMFCQYVLEVRGLMVYVINDNLQDTDIMHKTAIRLESTEADEWYDEDIDESEAHVGIMEIRDMDNKNEYSGSMGTGWNKEYDNYLTDWDIPLEKILSDIQVELDSLDDERDTYNISKQMNQIINDIGVDLPIDTIERMEEIFDKGYVPHTVDLNKVLDMSMNNDKDIIDFLLQFKTVKPNIDTYNIALITDNTYMIRYMLDNVKLNPKHLKYSMIIMDNPDLLEKYEKLGVPYDDISLGYAIEHDDMDAFNKYIDSGAIAGSYTINAIFNTVSASKATKLYNLIRKNIKIKNSRIISYLIRIGREDVILDMINDGAIDRSIKYSAMKQLVDAPTKLIHTFIGMFDDEDMKIIQSQYDNDYLDIINSLIQVNNIDSIKDLVDAGLKIDQKTINLLELHIKHNNISQEDYEYIKNKNDRN